MPYVEKARRNKGTLSQPCGPGELNYAITTLVLNYYLYSGQNYKAINDVVGALTCAKDEFYRRVAVPYEDQKIQENGDVY